MSILAELELELARSEGYAFNGMVNIRAFDEGMVETLGALKATVTLPPTDRPDTETDPIEGYFLPLQGVAYPPGCPGIPVVFSHPEDRFSKYRKSSIMVRRDDITPAMQRWHPAATQARFPAPGALPITYKDRHGFQHMETTPQAVPYDISYTITMMSQYRGEANALVDHVLRVYGPYSNVRVSDSLGDHRLYSTFTTSTSIIDDNADIADRTIGFTVSVRVEAELDQVDPESSPTVTQGPVITGKPI